MCQGVETAVFVATTASDLLQPQHGLPVSSVALSLGSLHAAEAEAEARSGGLLDAFSYLSAASSAPG